MFEQLHTTINDLKLDRSSKLIESMEYAYDHKLKEFREQINNFTK